MCVNIIVGDELCTVHGELVEALGGTPVYHPEVDARDMSANDCLCGIDQAATAAKFGYRFGGRDDFGDVIMTRSLH
jgi:hypothetical protein